MSQDVSLWETMMMARLEREEQGQNAIASAWVWWIYGFILCNKEKKERRMKFCDFLKWENLFEIFTDNFLNFNLF